ncbi:hypothetical protein LWI28_008210 [Acer negundo]|uniref:Uncharacterized protein n=1 Tax=Acer negundo TaxID=4023 RepID=A0AAD5JAI6_ACENE|nr:hypothetical protein LWI28_008210 [Acer negundo]
MTGLSSGGDWGSSLHISRSEFQVPTQFNRRDQWEKGSISAEVEGVLKNIMTRSYVNLKFPISDAFKSDKVNRYLMVSLAHPGVKVPRRLSSYCIMNSTGPLNPNPTSPQPSDSLEALFDSAKIESSDNLLSYKRKKELVKEALENITFSLRHRSNRNLCIGSSFQNKSSDPIHIVDEEEENKTVGQVEIPPMGGEILDLFFDY